MLKPFYMAVLFAALCITGLSTKAAAADKCERLIATGSPEYPPFLWRDPQNPERLIGASADLLKRVGDDLGIEINVIYTGPWSRALNEVRTGRVDMIAGAFITLDRLEQMDYVHPPMLVTPNVVWVPKNSELVYEQWDDLKGLKGDKLLGNSLGVHFDQFARDNLTLDEVSSITQSFQKLLLNRSDYVIYGRQPGEALAYTIGSAQELKALEPAISYEGLHLTLSHNSVCNDAHLRGQLARKMTELVETGLPEQLLHSNQLLWQLQHAPAAADGVINQ